MAFPGLGFPLLRCTYSRVLAPFITGPHVSTMTTVSVIQPFFVFDDDGVQLGAGSQSETHVPTFGALETRPRLLTDKR
ncbi:hypothetical protein Q5P01_013047 [Channa striata]|uniref:Uncharacterized protein n=1 Tax=Channa striata TaxID=64152 RepID=A0AA88MQL2_CHASR|nr:hypothetical protein Q5P01_013047 [Channa striata]